MPAEPPTPTPGLDPEDHARVFVETYHACVGMVFRALRRFGISEAELEDATQEVFVVVYRKLGTFDASRAGIKTWVYGIARGVAANRRRAALRIARCDEKAPSPSPAEDPALGIAARQAGDLVERFLATLSPERRVVFELVEIEEIAVTEVARLLDTNRNTVFTRLRAARRSFAAWVAALEDTSPLPTTTQGAGR